MQPEERVVTGEAVMLELQIAGPGSRGIAAVIDLAVMGVGQILIFVLLAAFNFDSFDTVLTVILVVEVLLLLGYPVGMETLWGGRTLGKAAMGLRVVRDDGGPIRFRHAFVRGITGVVVEKPGISYGIVALISMICTKRTKRLGDLAAGTMVLQERVPGKLDAQILMPPPLAAWAAGLDLTGINDSLSLRIRHFIGRAGQLSPEARGSLEHSLAVEVVAQVGQPPAGAPGWAILSAVLAERRRRAFNATQPAVAPWPGSAPAYGAVPSYQPPIAPVEPAHPWAVPGAARPPSYAIAGSEPATTGDSSPATAVPVPATATDDQHTAPAPPSTTGFAPPG